MVAKYFSPLCMSCTILLLAAAVGSAQGGEAVGWRSNLDAAKMEAGQSGRLVLVHFWGTSCGPCRALDKQVFSQPHVGVEIEKKFVPIKLEAGRSPALANLYRIDRVPTDVILTSQGNLVAKLQCPPTPEGYLTQLSNLAGHYQRQTATMNVAASETSFNAAYAGLEVGQRPSTPNPAQPNSASQQQVQQASAEITNPWIANSPAPSGPASSTTPSATNSRYQDQTANSPFSAATGQATVPATAMPQSYHRQSAQLVTSEAANAVPSKTASAPSGAAAIAPAVQPSVTQVSANSTPSAESSRGTSPLPAGSPSLGFDGFCPVSLNFSHKWVRGNPTFGAVHRGRTYLFVGENERQQFLANPDAYSPVFSGMDPVEMLDSKKVVEGSRKFGFKWRDAFYLFSSQATMERFANNPDRYAAGVRQAMSQLDASTGTIQR